MNNKKSELLNSIAEDCFKYEEYSLDEFNALVGRVFPIFGSMEIELKEVEGGYKLKYVDRDIGYYKEEDADGSLIEQEIDMSCRILDLNLDTDGVVKIIDHSYHLFTPANKREVMFCIGMIGKKILL